MKIILNPDEKVVKQVDEILSSNGGYCPCSLIESEDTKCVCKAFLDCEEEGPCHCGKYIKVFD